MSNETDALPILVLVGPTAIGKTALSLHLAHTFNCEIISLDSVQVYRYLDIGTAKIRPEEQKGIAHYCLDLVDPDQHYDAACYGIDASNAVRIIRQKNKIPLFTGGTGLYLRAVSKGLFTIPKIPEIIRNNLQKRLTSDGIHTLYQELVATDPLSAKRIHTNDTSRIIRALEILQATGQSWSDHLNQQGNGSVKGIAGRYLKIGLTCDKEQLHQRIDARTEQMLSSGFQSEVQSLLEKGYSPDSQALGAIGYRQMVEYLQGDLKISKLHYSISLSTKQYAKRQYTWFRKEPDLQWFDHQEITRIEQEVQNFLANCTYHNA